MNLGLFHEQALDLKIVTLVAVDERALRLMKVWGVGPLIATVLISPRQFCRGREPSTILRPVRGFRSFSGSAGAREAAHTRAFPVLLGIGTKGCVDFTLARCSEMRLAPQRNLC